MGYRRVLRQRAQQAQGEVVELVAIDCCAFVARVVVEAFDEMGVAMLVDLDAGHALVGQQGVEVAADPAPEIFLMFYPGGRIYGVDQVIPVNFAELDAIGCHRIRIQDLVRQSPSFSLPNISVRRRKRFLL
jgi:hypothetical protein